MPNDRLKCPSLSVPEPKVDSTEENDSEIKLWCKNEKVEELNLKFCDEESSKGVELIESSTTVRIKIENEELDQKEANLCLDESSYIKWETINFKKIEDKFNDSNIDKEFDINATEPLAIKEENNDVNNIESDELNYSHESFVEPETIKLEEVHIKPEEDGEDKLNEKIAKAKKPTVLYKCSECPYSTFRKDHLKSHSVTHKTEDEIDWFRCSECSYKSCRKGGIIRHKKIHNINSKLSEFKKHQIEYKPYIQWLDCPQCSFKTHLQSHFRRHLLTHKSDAFKCLKCPYQSRTKRQLTIHQAKHESLDKWHLCPICPYKAYDKRILQIHCRARHSIDLNNSKPIEIFKCTKCSYESGFKGSLKMHELIHDQKSWIQCPDCSYNTPYKRYLRKHQVQHLGENSEGCHKCPECPYKTLDKSSLEKHIISHRTADEIQWFECSQCSFKTPYKYYLKEHRLTHKKAQEIEWFFCYECSFKTRYKRSLPRHFLMHKK